MRINALFSQEAFLMRMWKIKEREELQQQQKKMITIYNLPILKYAGKYIEKMLLLVSTPRNTDNQNILYIQEPAQIQSTILSWGPAHTTWTAKVNYWLDKGMYNI